MGDLIDLSEALGELQMSEEELQNLVARGDLRVVRSRGKMMFHRSDINSLQKERATEPTIIIPASDPGGGRGSASALDIDLPDTAGVDESAATVVPESGTEEIVFDDSELDILPTDAAATAEVTVSESPEEVPIAYEEEPGAYEEAPAERPSARASAVSRRLHAAYEVQAGSPIMSAVLVLTTVIMMLAATLYTVILYKGYYDESNKVKYVPSFMESVYDMVRPEETR